MKKNTLFLFLIFFSKALIADKYFISFTDKDGVSFDPCLYFSDRTINQRTLSGLLVCDSSDFPLREDYVKTISQKVDSVTMISRWLNGMAVIATSEQIRDINKLPFVRSLESLTANQVLSSKNKTGNLPSVPSSELSALMLYQCDRMQARIFRDAGFDGKGIRIAVFDAGFPSVDKHMAFNELRSRGGIIATHDFTKNKEDVYRGSWHGTATLSCLAGKWDTVALGMATGAEFLLALTEFPVREPFSEEEYWLAAAEWADRLGANIISSSLGYTVPRYFQKDMNGKRSLVAKAANMAASKGILVVNAAGNECEDSWHFIDTPADADSVLAVGGTEPTTDYHIGFSSLGPTSDGRMKPNVCGSGRAVVANAAGYSIQSGTSFSTPLVAGFAAAAWQSNRRMNNMELFHEIEKSAHLFPYFDYAHGFGIPQASYFVSGKNDAAPTFDFVVINDEFKVILREAYSYVQNEYSLGYHPVRNLFYKVEDKSGTMKSYSVLLAEEKEVLHGFSNDYDPGDMITIHFEGFTRSFIPKPIE